MEYSCVTISLFNSSIVKKKKKKQFNVQKLRVRIYQKGFKNNNTLKNKNAS